MKIKTLISAAALIGSATVVLTSGPASASPIVGSYSTALAANLTALDLVNVSIGPIALASGVAPGPYNANTTLASLNVSGNLILGSLGTTTGVIVDTASSNYQPMLSGTATSTVNGLDMNLSLALLGSLLDVSATTLTSTSTASYFGSPLYTGSSEIENLFISGTALGGPGIHVNAGGLAATPVNDILLNLGDIAIVANYQTPFYNGSQIDGIQTAALAIGFNNFAFGTGLLSGEILIGDSAAAVTGVPEPASWALMLTGFGLLGAAVRRRRALPATTV